MNTYARNSRREGYTTFFITMQPFFSLTSHALNNWLTVSFTFKQSFSSGGTERSNGCNYLRMQGGETEGGEKTVRHYWFQNLLDKQERVRKKEKEREESGLNRQVKKTKKGMSCLKGGCVCLLLLLLALLLHLSPETYRKKIAYLLVETRALNSDCLYRVYRNFLCHRHPRRFRMFITMYDITVPFSLKKQDVLHRRATHLSLLCPYMGILRL